MCHDEVRDLVRGDLELTGEEDAFIDFLRDVGDDDIADQRTQVALDDLEFTGDRARGKRHGDVDDGFERCIHQKLVGGG